MSSLALSAMLLFALPAGIRANETAPPVGAPTASAEPASTPIVDPTSPAGPDLKTPSPRLAPDPIPPASHPTTETLVGTKPPARSAIALSDGRLREAVARLAAGGVASPDVLVKNGLVLVEVLYTGDKVDASRQIATLGGVINGAAGTSLLQALVPFQNLVRLEASPGISFVRVPLRADEPLTLGEDRAEPDATLSAVIGQELSKTNAAAWHTAGITGVGVKIGIVDSFDQAAWNAAQAAGEVPAPTDTFCLIGGIPCNIFASANKHGEGVAEIIHEMAPGAQIYLATARTASDLQAAVNFFASNGVQILSRSLTAEYDGKGDGTGPIAQVVDSAVAQGMAWFNSAGNSAGKVQVPVRLGSYWRGAWKDANANGFLEWSGTDELLAVPCSSVGRFINGLRWSDWGANRTDYDVFLYEDAGATILKASGRNDQAAGFNPVESLSASCTDVDYVAVQLFAAGGGTAGDTLEFQVNGTGLEYWQNPFSAAVPAADSANAGALSIGAIDPALGITIADYSSQGPTNDGRVKPDISAAACVLSFTYAPACFNGTSAATPVAAGAAALVRSAGLALSASQLKTYLLTQARVDRGAPGTDNVYGVGELVLPAPPVTNTPPTISNIADQTTPANTLEGPVGFTIGDAQTAASSLTVAGSSSNTTLVPNANITFAGTGASRSLRVTPAANQTGVTTITVTVSDGALTARDTFQQTVSATTTVAPVAAFSATPTVGNAPLHIQFTDASTNGPTSWEWQIIDALRDVTVTTMTDQDPSVDLPDPGLYTVRLTAGNAAGTDAEEKLAYIEVDAPNDDFASATVISALGSATVPVDETWTDTATTQPGLGEKNPAASCIGDAPGAAISHTLWYRLRLPTNARVTIATADFSSGGSGLDSSFDTVLEIGTGTSPGTFVPIACNDDADGTGTLQSRVVAGLAGNRDYYVRVGGFGDAFGQLALYVSGTVDTIAPSVTASRPTLVKGPMSGTLVPVRVAWTASDGNGTGLDSFQIQRRACSVSTAACSATWTTVTTGIPGTTRSVTLYGPAGYFEYRVIATDNAANSRASAVRIRLTGYQNTSRKVSLTARKWKRSVSSPSAWGGSFARSVGARGRARLTIPKGTRQVAWVGRVYGTAGTASVYVDGVRRATINLRTASSSGWRRLVWVRSVSSTRSHVIEIRWRSGTINLDALVTAR